MHVQQFPLEPLPTEGIFLILRVSRNLTINEKRQSCFPYLIEPELLVVVVTAVLLDV